MASKIETGHAKNIANFEDLISFCIGYGTMYNPGTAQLQVAALQNKYNATLADLQAVVNAKTTYDDLTNKREILFKELDPLATRLVSALSYSGVPKQTIDDARTILRKLHGNRKKPKEKEPAGPPVEGGEPKDKTISASHQSYDALLFSLMELVDLLSAQPLYTPNEVELSIAALNNRITLMKDSTTAVTNAITVINTARISRNKSLYEPSGGLVHIALNVKLYVRSLFGTASPEYKKVTKLSFKFLVK